MSILHEGTRLCAAAAPIRVCPRPTVLVTSKHATVTIGAMVAGAHDAVERTAAASKAAAEKATRF